MDFEEKLVEYLADQTGIAWYHAVPMDKPEEFGTVSRSGGGRALVEDSPMYTLKIWATTWKRARLLSQLVSQAVDGIAEGIDCAMASSVMSVYDDPDDSSRTPRRRVTAQIVFND